MTQLVKHLCSLTVLLLFALCPLQAGAEESYNITLEKGGQLSKHIKKGDVLNVKLLTISGPLNNLDLELISSMSNLEELDLKDAVLSNEKYDLKKNRDFYDNRVFKLPPLSKLRKLITSKEYYNLQNLKSLPSLKYLAVFDGDIDGRLEDDNITLSLDTLALLSTKELRRSPSEYDLERYLKNGVDYELEKYSKELTRPIKTKVLISEIDGLAYADHSDVIANIIKIPGYTILYHWSPELTDKELETVDVLVPFAYIGYNSTSLKIPSKVKRLPSNLFGYSRKVKLPIILNFNIPEYNEYVAEISERIKLAGEKPEDYIKVLEYPLYSNIENFDLSNIEDIDARAFDGCVVEKIILPETLKYFHTSALENCPIEEAVFTSSSAPIVYDKYYKPGDYGTTSYLTKTPTKFVAPKGKIDRFRIGAWGIDQRGNQSACVLEDGVEHTYSFDISAPGTLSEHISDDLALNIENLTISGVLYDTDFQTLKKCKNLRVLDLRKCYVALSPETIKQNKKNTEALLGLLGMVFEGAAADSKAKFENGVGSYSDAAYTDAMNKKYSELMNGYDKEKGLPVDRSCRLPEEAFKGLEFLTAVGYPIMLESLDNGTIYSRGLRQVILPPNLVKLNANVGGKFLTKIQIPSTVKHIGPYAFSGSPNLLEIDLRNTNVETFDWTALNDCTGLERFYGSPMLSKFTYNDYHSHIPTIKVGWFYTKQKPENLDNFELIHIPQGFSAAYNNLPGIAVVDDIEL